MARRAAPPAEPAYLPHIPSQGRRLGNPDESGFSRFIREEIFSPEKLPGNLSILTASVLFAGGIAAVRTWGELMVPV
ncbi:hypothetical protein CC1G_05837 [Coprinopsis cinerea okayama7|uniref:TOM core complex subunit Tom6 n=1 Tax=Coprinopsis cinerea (strain Okayama-7 / 130 / ATCC MYA-4618 / FGSC 9003) TaxID=240176 RepID=A8NLJ2_COPC7|nr:hypothetical protein CC1G_05837 [Coprinopsis cinerea okayama7\|eukprot:XP_001834700.1 hypothetical protein CC1G_05837 [Coprinopsis cinerea okayama7\